MQLTVFHDGQFWVAVIEVSDEGNLFFHKHVFGSEPSDSAIFDFVNSEAFRSIPNPANRQNSDRDRFPASAQASEKNKDSNSYCNPSCNILKSPKRAAREAARALQERGVSTYAQKALKAQIEGSKAERKVVRRLKKEELAKQKYELSREKAKKRHRGR